MRPFISPARITLLSLIDLYCSNGVLPEDDDFILELIGSYMADNYAHPSNKRQRHEARWQRAYLNVDLLARLHSLQAPLQSCFSAQTAEDLPMCATLWDALVARLWLRLTCLDDLGPFFDALGQHVAPTTRTCACVARWASPTLPRPCCCSTAARPWASSSTSRTLSSPVSASPAAATSGRLRALPAPLAARLCHSLAPRLSHGRAADGFRPCQRPADLGRQDRRYCSRGL